MFRIDGELTSETFGDADTSEADFAAAVEFKTLVAQVGGAAARRIRDARNGQGQATRVPTLRAWFDTWSSTRTDVTDGTIAEDRRLANRSWMPTFGDWPVDTIERDEIKKWVIARRSATTKRSTTIASKTIKNEHGLLSTVLGAAVPKWRPDNPARGIGIPDDVHEEMVFLTQAEFYLLLGYVPKQWRPLLVTLAGTGLRWGEITALRWKDVNMDATPPRLSVIQAWKKGVTTRVIGRPKTKRSRRTISLPSQVVHELRLLPHGEPDQYVFRGSRGGRIHHQNFHPRVWATAVRLANNPVDADGNELPNAARLGKNPRIHDLRHSHASWLIAQGTDIFKVSRRLGHESIKTTDDTYAHLMPDHLETTAAAAEAALTPPLLPTPAAIDAADRVQPLGEDVVDGEIVEDDD